MPAIYLALRETRSANLRGYSRSTVGWRKCQGNLVQSMPAIRIIVWRRDPTNYNTLLISCYAHRHSFCSPYSRVSCFIFWLTMLENEGYFFTRSLARLISFWSAVKASSKIHNTRKTQQSAYKILLERFDYISLGERNRNVKRVTFGKVAYFFLFLPRMFRASRSYKNSKESRLFSRWIPSVGTNKKTICILHHR